MGLRGVAPTRWHASGPNKRADAQAAVNLGTCHGALLMTTRGDTSQITLEELQRVAGGGSARIIR